MEDIQKRVHIRYWCYFGVTALLIFAGVVLALIFDNWTIAYILFGCAGTAWLFACITHTSADKIDYLECQRKGIITEHDGSDKF